MASFTYEQQAILASWNNIDLMRETGADTFLQIETNSVRVEHVVSGDGKAIASKMSDRTATATLTLMQTSPVNQELAKVLLEQEKIGAQVIKKNFVVTDLVGNAANFIALGATLTDTPNPEYARTAGERQWVWNIETFIPCDDPADVLNNLGDYIVL